MIDDKYLKDNYIYYADVGAKGGVNPKWINETKNFFSILFEPNPSSYEKLLENKKSNEIIINSALSDKKENILLNICESDGASSVFYPNYNLLNLYYNSDRFKIKNTSRIKADTLDNQLKINNIDDIDFLKIDVQGYELNVLKGSINSLKSIIGLEIECEISQMYLNQPLFDNVFQFVKKYEFHLFDLKRYYWKRKVGKVNNQKKGQIIFVDTLFLKQPEYIIKEYSNDTKKLIKAFYIYLYYGYSDLSLILLNYLQNNKIIKNDQINILKANLINADKNYFTLPNFFGKKVLKKIFQTLFMIFSDKNYYYKTLEWKKNHFLGNDHDLGN